MSDTSAENGKALRAARNKAKLTRLQLAEKLGVSKSSVYAWETGATGFERRHADIEKLLGPVGTGAPAAGGGSLEVGSELSASAAGSTAVKKSPAKKAVAKTATKKAATKTAAGKTVSKTTPAKKVVAKAAMAATQPAVVTAQAEAPAAETQWAMVILSDHGTFKQGGAELVDLRGLPADQVLTRLVKTLRADQVTALLARLGS